MLDRIVRKPWERLRVQTRFEIVDEDGEIKPDVGKTDSSQKDACDVNNIIATYDRTGILPMPERTGRYGDVSNLNKYYGELVEQARSDIADATDFINKKQAEMAEAERLQIEAEKEQLVKERLKAERAAENSG